MWVECDYLSRRAPTPEGGAGRGGAGRGGVKCIAWQAGRAADRLERDGLSKIQSNGQPLAASRLHCCVPFLLVSIRSYRGAVAQRGAALQLAAPEGRAFLSHVVGTVAGYFYNIHPVVHNFVSNVPLRHATPRSALPLPGGARPIVLRPNCGVRASSGQSPVPYRVQGV